MRFLDLRKDLRFTAARRWPTIHQMLRLLPRFTLLPVAAAAIIAALAATTAVLGYDRLFTSTAGSEVRAPRTVDGLSSASPSPSPTATPSPTPTPGVYACRVAGTTPAYFEMHTPGPAEDCSLVPENLVGTLRSDLAESARRGVPLLGPCGMRGYPDLRPECARTPQPVSTPVGRGAPAPSATPSVAPPARPSPKPTATQSGYTPPSPPIAAPKTCIALPPGQVPAPRPSSPPSSYRPTIALSPTHGAPGTSVTLTGSGFPPGAVVVFYENGELAANPGGGIAGATADGSGNLSFSSSVPLWICPGVYLVQAVGVDTGVMASVQFTVDP